MSDDSAVAHGISPGPNLCKGVCRLRVTVDIHGFTMLRMPENSGGDLILP